MGISVLSMIQPDVDLLLVFLGSSFALLFMVCTHCLDSAHVFIIVNNGKEVVPKTFTKE